MDRREPEKLRRVVFERLVCGEDPSALRAQLENQLPPDEARLIVEDAQARIARGRGTPAFTRQADKIRRRRLVGVRFLAWKILGIGMLLASGAGTLLYLMGVYENASFMGIIIGGVILAVTEWRERRFVEGKLGGATPR